MDDLLNGRPLPWIYLEHPPNQFNESQINAFFLGAYSPRLPSVRGYILVKLLFNECELMRLQVAQAGHVLDGVEVVAISQQMPHIEEHFSED